MYENGLTATDKGIEVLQVIHDYLLEKGRPPALIEIAEALGIAKSSVRDRLGTLEWGGWIARRPGENHGIELLVPLSDIPGRNPLVQVEAADLIETLGMLRAYAKCLRKPQNQRKVRSTANRLKKALENQYGRDRSKSRPTP